SSESRNFYLRVKGETELALIALRFRSLHLMQPSLLLGARREWRPAGAVARDSSQRSRPRHGRSRSAWDSGQSSPYLARAALARHRRAVAEVSVTRLPVEAT